MIGIQRGHRDFVLFVPFVKIVYAVRAALRRAR